MSILTYKGYEGTAEVDMESCVCRGKVLFIEDLVTYQAHDPGTLKKSFEDAVEDYLETCKELGREPRKPLKGQFSVRISPELHKQAVLYATDHGVSLNKVVAIAMDHFLNSSSEVEHHVTIGMEPFLNEFTTVMASSSMEPVTWQDNKEHVH